MDRSSWVSQWGQTISVYTDECCFLWPFKVVGLRITLELTKKTKKPENQTSNIVVFRWASDTKAGKSFKRLYNWLRMSILRWNFDQRKQIKRWLAWYLMVEKKKDVVSSRFFIFRSFRSVPTLRRKKKATNFWKVSKERWIIEYLIVAVF